MREQFGINHDKVFTSSKIDEGLRSYMLRVYNHMGIGLVLTAVAAYLVANTGFFSLFYGFTPENTLSLTFLGWIAVLSPLAMVFILNARIHSMKASTAHLMFWVFSILMGISLTPITFVYTGASIAKVFFITSGTFAGMSLYGYTTKKDLTGFGSFLIMGLIGIIIASIVNIFIASSMMDFVISCIGVLIFVGLTAYDTQKIRQMYNENDGSEIASKKAIRGALSLYLDFINLFLFLLRLFGDRR